jgi:hypothetical protein
MPESESDREKAAATIVVDRLFEWTDVTRSPSVRLSEDPVMRCGNCHAGNRKLAVLASNPLAGSVLD